MNGFSTGIVPVAVKALLENSDHIVLDLDEERGSVAGFITAITDGALSAYTPDLENLPGYQKRRIGTGQMRRMLQTWMFLVMRLPEMPEHVGRNAAFGCRKAIAVATGHSESL